MVEESKHTGLWMGGSRHESQHVERPPLRKLPRGICRGTKPVSARSAYAVCRAHPRHNSNRSLRLGLPLHKSLRPRLSVYDRRRILQQAVTRQSSEKRFGWPETIGLCRQACRGAARPPRGRQTAISPETSASHTTGTRGGITGTLRQFHQRWKIRLLQPVCLITLPTTINSASRHGIWRRDLVSVHEGHAEREQSRGGSSADNKLQRSGSATIPRNLPALRRSGRR